MFANDLILIIKATRKNARNCLRCLNVYENLSGQKPNFLKYAIYVPSWYDKKLAKSISKILGISLESFPFTYLGIPISSKKLQIIQLQHIPTRVRNTIQSQNHSSISTVGHGILLNNVIFAIPNYILSVMNLPYNIMDNISKLARNFLWVKTSNNASFHSIGWIGTTLSKLEGGLEIRNLR